MTARPVAHPARHDSPPATTDVLEAALVLVTTDRPGAVDAFVEQIGSVLAGEVGPLIGILTGDCPRAPMKVPAGTGREQAPTTTELFLLGEQARADGSPWRGRGTVAGSERDVIVVSTTAGTISGTVVFADVPMGLAPTPESAAVLQGLCEVLMARYADRAGEAAPGGLLDSTIAVQERTRVLAEITGTLGSSLRSIASALRSSHLDDAHARQIALDQVSSALLDLKAAHEAERQLGTMRASRSFAALNDELRALTRDRVAVVETVAPVDDPDLPADVANAFRVITRDIALSLLDERVGRVRVEWRVEAGALTAIVRDDGEGLHAPTAVSDDRLVNQVDDIDAQLTTELVPGWGTTVTVRVPLGRRDVPEPGPLAALNDREREVLDLVAEGLRNRQVADRLNLSEHTVKFHLANVMRKLDVRSRGEAAALVRATPSA